MTELLPCPFCGPGQSMVDPWFDDVAKRWAVGCGRCGSSSGRSVHAEGSKEAAIKSWNTRGLGEPSRPGRAGREEIASELARFFPGKQTLRNQAADAILALLNSNAEPANHATAERQPETVGDDRERMEAGSMKAIVTGDPASTHSTLPPQDGRIPKVRTSHHRNKEEAARLQALVNERCAAPPAPVADRAERCLTCDRSDAEYHAGSRSCPDPWHGDDHLRAKTATLPRAERGTGS